MTDVPSEWVCNEAIVEDASAPLAVQLIKRRRREQKPCEHSAGLQSDP